MRFLNKRALIFVCSALCISTLCVGAAGADTATYVYRGNNFVELEGEPGIFSTKDRVTGRFTVDCSAAHSEGTCANLPYDNYFWVGAVSLESMNFSAGPATLPTAEGHADINEFSFSTDSSGQIVDWNIDLTFPDPSGLINVDTDNKPWRQIDSAAALDGGAVVIDNPGRWKKIGRPDKHFKPVFQDHIRTYGNSVAADVCVDIPRINIHRCSNLHAWEDYDLKGTFRFTGIEINYWYIRFLNDGGYRQGWRWISCRAGVEAIKVHPDQVTLEAILHPDSPECDSYGERQVCDASDNCGPMNPWDFDDPTEVVGEWIDPINTAKVVANHTNNSYDPWSETSHRSSVHCNENGGDMMTHGGFSIGNRYFPFEGFYTHGWSHYWLRSCNNNHNQK